MAVVEKLCACDACMAIIWFVATVVEVFGETHNEGGPCKMRSKYWFCKFILLAILYVNYWLDLPVATRLADM